MEDVIGNIIYILLTLGLVIFTVLKKKKVDKHARPAPDQEVRDPMDEVFPTLKDLFGDDEQREEVWQEEPQRIEPAAQPADANVGKPFVKEDYVFTARDGAKAARRGRKIPHRKGPLRDRPEEHSYERDYGIKDFDLRQAIIYSEILKRPDL